VGEPHRIEDGGLVLLVDNDVDTRRHARHLLELHGMEVVQASNGIAALELVQRLPRSFRLVITELDLPGLPGTVVAETLRIFRPDITTLCMSRRLETGAAGDRRCLASPIQGPDLQAAIQNGHAFRGPDGRPHVSEASVARARARYAVVGDLVEAALELARATGTDEG